MKALKNTTSNQEQHESLQPKAKNQGTSNSILQAYKDKTVQRQSEEEELLQGKFETTQFVSEEDELLQGKLESVQRMIDEEEPIQGKFETTQLAIEEEEPLQRQPNNTGLPDNLKSGIENLSGYSMNDVKVHYNSSKPATLQAHAYAQGTDIHVAPGQEKHVPHEAWHVVQQKQGRVKPTMQLKGTVPVNDDAGLEKEADVMGARAMNTHSVAQQKKDSSISTNIVQKRDPTRINIPKDQILTHGSAVEDFLVDMTDKGKGTKDVPDGPAWLAEDDEAFSVHATVAMQGYNKLNDGDSKDATVHVYKANEDIPLDSWDDWNEVPEYIYYKDNNGIYPRDRSDIEKNEKEAMSHAEKNDEDISWNSKEAANRLKSHISENGYRIKKDLVLGKPEDILFDKGLQKLQRSEKRKFTVTKKSSTLLEIIGSTNSYTYDPSDITSFSKK